jgi:hypothetical protein
MTEEKVRPGENRTAREESPGMTDERETNPPAVGKDLPCVQGPEQGPSLIPWSVLFPQGHPMRGAGRS